MNQIVRSSLSLPSLRPTLFLRTLYLIFSAKSIQCVRQWWASALGIPYFGSHSKKIITQVFPYHALYESMEKCLTQHLMKL